MLADFVCNCITQSGDERSKFWRKQSHKFFWNRTNITKEDKKMRYNMEQARNIREGEEIMTMDINRLLLYVEKNRDDCDGEKKAIFHVMNDGDIHRLEAYLVEDPFKLGSYYLIEELTCLIFKRSVVAQILSWYIISYFK
ncbi:hypothetical protein DCAR_0100509 [Daucus carota subsp. sativus]|uniref:Uncharacterized protein n=1 Tax=Daucus carota subsp. sativus TaxID=79200 RepID=A0AAF0W3Y7_DAUCS|nr:hypothetical protein DCAR_0100509 [Daucus carota subsp. sativus]